VYEITSKATFELVVSARQKIALRNKDVSTDCKEIEIRYLSYPTVIILYYCMGTRSIPI
jgi:hypothetical protein